MCTVTVTAENDLTQVAFKNCALSIKCITKLNGTIDDAEDLDLVILMYNLI